MEGGQLCPPPLGTGAFQYAGAHRVKSYYFQLEDNTCRRCVRGNNFFSKRTLWVDCLFYAIFQNPITQNKTHFYPYPGILLNQNSIKVLVNPCFSLMRVSVL